MLRRRERLRGRLMVQHPQERQKQPLRVQPKKHYKAQMRPTQMGQTQKSLIQRLMTRPQVYLSSTRTDLIQMNHHHQAQRYIWGLLGV